MDLKKGIYSRYHPHKTRLFCPESARNCTEILSTITHFIPFSSWIYFRFHPRYFTFNTILARSFRERCLIWDIRGSCMQPYICLSINTSICLFAKELGGPQRSSEGLRGARGPKSTTYPSPPWIAFHALPIPQLSVDVKPKSADIINYTTCP